MLKPLLIGELAIDDAGVARGVIDEIREHCEQGLRYLRNYRVSPKQVAIQKPVTWLLLTKVSWLPNSKKLRCQKRSSSKVESRK